MIFGYLCIPMLLYIFAVFVPLVTSLFYSFFEWKGGPNKTFIGIENYITLLKDTTFWQAFGHNIYLVILCVIGTGRRGLCICYDHQYPVCEAERNPQNLWILPQHDLRSCGRFYLDHDL